MATVILSDSRGLHLSDILLREQNMNISAYYYNGANLERIRRMAEVVLENMEVSTLYINAGINDVTRKPHGQKSLYIPYDSAAEVVNMVMERVRRCYLRIKQNHPNLKIVFMTITGIDIMRYNKTHTVHPDQDMINTSMVKLNEEILKYNQSHSCRTPMIHEVVHYKPGQGRPTKHYYSRLIDGLHPTARTVSKWGKIIARAVELNME